MSRAAAPSQGHRCAGEDIVIRTLESMPDNAKHWSTRSMAKATGLNDTTVWR